MYLLKVHQFEAASKPKDFEPGPAGEMAFLLFLFAVLVSINTVRALTNIICIFPKPGRT
jgi:hypothetical protein